MQFYRLLAIAGVLFVLLCVKLFVVDTMREPEIVYDDSSPAGYAIQGTPTLVNLSVDWCGPCKLLKPVLKDLKSEYNGRVATRTVNPEKDRAAAKAYKPRAYPTLVFHTADGSVHRRIEGAPTKAYIKNIFDDMGI